MSTSKKWPPIIEALASAKIFYYTVLWLFVLVFVGTLAQGDIGTKEDGTVLIKGIGLHASQEKYFSSWFIWLKGFPVLPAGRLTMAIVFFNLLFKFVFKSSWNIKKTGINIAHLGSMILLAGGFITAKGAYEGIMLIPEGSSANYFSDFHETELAFTHTKENGDQDVVAIAESELYEGNEITLKDFAGAQIKVLNFYQNASRTLMPTGQSPEAQDKGNAREYGLFEKDRNPEDEHNISGVELMLSGFGPDIDGRHVFYQLLNHPYVRDRKYIDLPFQKQWKEQVVGSGIYPNATEEPLAVKIQDKDWKISLRNRRYYVPFEIELEDVKSVMYPGTEIPKEYSSDIKFYFDGTVSEHKIWMNNPWRRSGYTMFQNSVLGNMREITGMSTVKNMGYSIPYISSIVICIGLMIHMGIMLPPLVRQLKNENEKLTPEENVHSEEDFYGEIKKESVTASPETPNPEEEIKE